jgi:Holliday junction resolvase RusA-like endonuclease
MKIVIYSQTPSQKNSKRILPNWKAKKVRLISSQRTLDWKEEAFKQLDPLNIHIRTDKRLQADYVFYVNDNTQRDLDNMIASANDILQQACADFAYNPKKKKMERVKKTGIIIGDHWKVLRIGSADAQVDKDNPRAEITITEIG